MIERLSALLLVVLVVGCEGSEPRSPQPAQSSGVAEAGEGAAEVGESSLAAELPVDVLDQPGYVGVVTAAEKSDVGPAVTGEVMTVHVRAGDHIEVGEPIATLDPRRAQEDLRMAEATLRSEKATLDQAKVDREEAAKRLRDAESLYEEGAVARGVIDDARFEHRRAKAAEARVAAVVAQWRTKAAQLERQLVDTELRAPFSGTIAQRYIDPGSLAGPGDPVVRLISSDALWVKFAVPATDLEELSVGTIVSAQLEDPAHSVDATVRQIDPETDPASQLVFVEAELDLDPTLRARVQVGAAVWVQTMDPKPNSNTDP